ncbi:MAG: DUF3426 domain-containing protein [Gallionella sp.]|nr:DUF3426 domain-containing protein [Gallionella sp.]
MNGTTLCPHCATRFKISEAQLATHHGMVRCGHCLQAFDARPDFFPEQPSPQLDLLTDELTEHAEAAVPEVHAELREFRVDETHEEAEAVTGIADISEQAVPDAAAPPEGEVADEMLELDDPEKITTETITYGAAIPEAPASESDDTLDFSLPTAFVHEQPGPANITPDDTNPFSEILPQTLAEQVVMAEEDIEETVPEKRRAWPLAMAALVLVVLLMAQAAYFFRVNLAARLPVLKPALVGYCQLLNCSVPLPQNTELIGIESSSLVAEPDHENQITLDVLLRNRASYSAAFPILELTLNDSQDRPLARRLFLPKEYLPTDESEQAGFPKNHEVNLKLSLNTADLRPEGYRLELFYPR